MADNSHTIVLLQFNDKIATRTYSEFDNPPKAMDGICQLFEQSLKKSNPDKQKISYDISELFAFIDKMHDLSCLVLNVSTLSYVPHDKEWIKQKVFAHLKAGQ